MNSSIYKKTTIFGQSNFYQQYGSEIINPSL